MARKRQRKLSKKEVKAQKKEDVKRSSEFLNTENDAQTEKVTAKSVDARPVEVSKVITVRVFSEKLGIPVTRVIAELMKNGVIASINESIDYETASIIGDELGYEIIPQKASEEKKIELTEEEKSHLVPRPPVVVVLGHVDHGKTTLLDSIRKTNIAEGESGGITQHIGAYQVRIKTKEQKNRETEEQKNKRTEKLKNKRTEEQRNKKAEKQNNERIITFLDTPGHEAFSAMRAHGANITDIAILVVAADDGVKPQTKEAISHAKAANVPIIIAINKIDKPGADPEKVKRELSDLDLVPEEWGGKTVMIPVSAKTGKNINELLDLILVVADMESLVANPHKPGEGVIIESHMQPGVGPIATVLVNDGEIKSGQIVTAGKTFGKIRFMEDYQGKRIDKAGPSTPIRIAGIHDIPKSGELISVVSDERAAKSKAAHSERKIGRFGLAEISEEAKKGTLKELNLIVRTDVQGSLEAIRNSLENLGGKEVKVNILSEAVGNVSESDVNMALASKALILGFKVLVPPQVRKLADEKEVKISLYDIIYNLIDDISAALSGMLEPEFIEEVTGKLEIIKIFFSSKNSKIAGGKVTSGKLVNGLKAHIYRAEELIGEGKITSLKLEQNPVSEVLKGFECGVGVDTNISLKPKDVIESFQTIEKVKKLK